MCEFSIAFLEIFPTCRHIIKAPLPCRSWEMIMRPAQHSSIPLGWLSIKAINKQ